MVHLYTNSGSEPNQVHRAMMPVEHETNRIVKATDVAMSITGAGSDFSVYEGQQKSKEQIMALAGNVDVQNCMNYMTVMSNTMSDEDYARLMEEGYNPQDMTVEEAVTVLDEIKVKLAQSGVVIEGYNDDVSREVLVEVTGSESAANALHASFTEADIPMTKENLKGAAEAFRQAGELTEITDGMCDYVLRNAMEPTLEHLYRVRFCASEVAIAQGGFYSEGIGGYLSRQAEGASIDSLRPRLEEVITEAGLSVDDTTLSQAKWLVESGIYLNSDNMRKLHDMKGIAFPIGARDLSNAVVNALARGREATQCYLNDTELMMTKSLRIAVSARVTEETRVMMTAESSYRMMRQGVITDVAAMSEMVETLKQIESDRLQALFGIEPGAEREAALQEAGRKATLWNATNDRLVTLALAPAAVVGKCVQVHAEVSLSYVCETGEQLAMKYKAAGEQYELLGTQVRKDLGDNIKKAFAGVDSLLEEMSLPQTEANRRAVRILGYNSMEITSQNIDAVKAQDSLLQRVINKMTPATTLRLIREGINPLECTPEELETTIDTYYDEPVKEGETYSRFLHHLEQRDGITPAERDSYIGIYRLLHQIQRGEGAALGSLMNQGAEVTFKNLLTAVRTGKRTGMDYAIDDSVGMRIKEAGYDMDISAQILQAFEEVAVGTEESRKSYYESQLKQMREMTAMVDEGTMETLLSFGKRASASELEALATMMSQTKASSGKSNPWNTLHDEIERYKSYDGAKAEEMEKELFSAAESLNGKEEFADTINSMEEIAGEILKNLYLAEETELLDVRAMNLMYKQISVMGSMARDEAYEVPVFMNGSFVGIRVKIIHGAEESGSVSASFSTEEYGTVVAGLQIMNHTVSGYIAGDDENGIRKLENEKKFEKALGENERQIGDLRYLYSESLDASFFYKRHDNDVTSEASTKELYELAKLFVTSLAD